MIREGQRIAREMGDRQTMICDLTFYGLLVLTIGSAVALVVWLCR